MIKDVISCAWLDILANIHMFDSSGGLLGVYNNPFTTAALKCRLFPVALLTSYMSVKVMELHLRAMEASWYSFFHVMVKHVTFWVYSLFLLANQQRFVWGVAKGKQSAEPVSD